MKKTLFLAATLLLSGNVMAATDHYILRDGNHVQHLKITKLGDDITVSTDVDFEPNADEKDKHACSADLSGKAKAISDTELLVKKHAESEARYCELKVLLSPTGAKIEQSDNCEDFVAGICHFSTNGKELLKIK